MTGHVLAYADKTSGGWVSLRHIFIRVLVLLLCAPLNSSHLHVSASPLQGHLFPYVCGLVHVRQTNGGHHLTQVPD